MSIHNPNIVDASLRDVASCLTDNQKVDLLLYAMKTLNYDGRSRIVFENAIQSCLSVSTLSPGNIARVRIMRARARLNAGAIFGAREDLHAALVADPDNPEAQALLHQRSVTVEKLLAPEPYIAPRSRFSPEIWREIASFLPRKDLKTLLHVPRPVCHVASSLLFRQLDLHFSGLSAEYPDEELDLDRERHAQRSADILARIITDNSFACVIRTLRVYSFKLDGDAGFHVGILSNAIPKLINLQNVHITGSMEGILSIIRILEFTRPRIKGLSIKSLDGALDLSGFNFSHLAHFSYEIPPGLTPSGSTAICPQSTTSFLSQNNLSLKKISLHTPSNGFPPPELLALRNLTHLSFTGCVPGSLPNLIPDILTLSRQLESLSLTVLADCVLSPHFRSLTTSLPFLRHFAFSIGGGVSRRLNDRDLFPSIAEFLRGRNELKSLTLSAPSTPSGVNNTEIQRLTGYDSGVWGALPTLTGLKCLSISWPKDLAPGLGGWLIPRNVKALVFDGIGANMIAERDPVSFFNQLRPGIPESLVYIGLLDSPIRSPAKIIEQGFPTVKLLRMDNSYWTVKSNLDSYQKEASMSVNKTASPGSTTFNAPTTALPLFSTAPTPRAILPSSLSHSHTPGYSHTSTTYHPSPLSISLANQSAPAGTRPILPSIPRTNSETRVPQVHAVRPPAPAPESKTTTATISRSSTLELEKWPRRRVAFHLSEWVEWLGCPEVVPCDRGDFEL